MKILSLRRCESNARQAPLAAPGDPLAKRVWPEAVARPWRYHLFQLLRQVDARAGGDYPLGRAPAPRHEPVRLGQQPALSFATGQIAAITRAAGRYYQIDIQGFGLFGPDGPLPLHMTEDAYQRQQQDKETSLPDFTNLFHHRLMTLLYRAWADTRPCLSFDRPDNRRLDYYADCLIGGSPSSTGGLPAAARYFMAGHLSRYPRNRAGLESILAYYFSVPARIRENLFHWLPLPRRQQLRLQRSASAPLGPGCCLGGAIPDRQYSLRIMLGPLTWRQYRQLLPVAPARQSAKAGGQARITQWVHQYLGLGYRWELQLILDSGHYRGCRLGHPHALGQGCWLGLNAGRRDRDDYICCPGPDGER